MPDLEKIKEQKRNYYHRNYNDEEFLKKYRDQRTKYYANNREKVIDKLRLKHMNKKLSLNDQDYVEILKHDELQDTNKRTSRHK